MSYDEGTVQVLTNFGNYTVLIPQDRMLSEKSARAIADQLAKLRFAIHATNNRIDGISLGESGVFSGPEYVCG
jgi:hypothetical protein